MLKIYRHTGFSTTIGSSIATPASDIAGNAVDADGNQYSSDLGGSKVFKHAGFTTTITSSFTVAGVAASSCGVDASGNFYLGDRTADKYYRYVGFTNTIGASINTPASQPRGGNVSRSGNLYSNNNVGLKNYLHSGFTTTISNSIATPGSSPRGCSVDKDGNLIDNDVSADKLYLHQGFSTTITTSIATPAGDVKGGDWETRLNETQTKTNTGATASAGALKKKPKRLLSGAVASAGALKKKAIRLLVGAVASAGSIASKLVFTKLLTGAVASAGVVKGKALKRVLGAIASAGALKRKTTRTLAGAVATAGVAIKKTKRLLSSSIASAGAVSDALTTDVDGLLSVDVNTLKMYQHSGFTTTIISSISTPASIPTGVSWLDSAEKLYSADAAVNKLYRHTGFSTTIESSFTSVDDPRGLSIDFDGHLYSAFSGIDKYQKHDGFSSTITSSFAITDDPRGISYYRDGNVYVSDLASVKHYKCVGFSSTISASFSGTRIDGSCITQAGDIIETQLTNSKFVRYVGFSATIQDSISSPSSSARDLEWKKRLTGSAFNKTIGGALSPLGALKGKAKKMLTGAITSAGVVLKKTKRNLSGAITPAGALAGEAIVIIRVLVEGVVASAGEVSPQAFLRIFQTLTGEIAPFGEVVGHSIFKRVVSGVVSSSGQTTKKAFKLVSGAIASVGALVSSGALSILRFAFDDQNPSVDGTVKYLVEMRGDAMPSGALSDESLFIKALRRAPEFQKNTGSVKGNVSGLSQVSIQLSNLDGKFNARNVDGFFVRIWRVFASQVIEFKGVVTEWTLGRDLELVVEDREAVVFNEQLPKRSLVKEIFANLPDKDAGKSLAVIHNRVRNAPLRLIGIDEANRNWDYACGEGVGKFGYFQSVETLYHRDAATSDVSGTVSSASGNTITVESADGRPVGFYQYQWIQVLDASTLAVLDEIDITAHNSERVVTLSRNPVVSASGKKYRIKYWRFYNGSQSSPYAGVAFVRLKKRLGEGNELDELYADMIGLPAANVVREAEDWLTHATWGLGLEINQTSFDDAASDSQLSNIKTEWGVFEKTDSGDIIETLLSTYGMGLVKNDIGLDIEIDEAKASAGTFGYADGYYDNIRSFSGLRHVHTNEKIRRLVIQYRKNYKESSTFIGTQSANVNTSGVEETLLCPQFYDHEDANRFLYYKVKKLIAEARRLTINVSEEGEHLRARDRIRVKIPLIGLDADFLIVSIARTNGEYRLDLRFYDASTYSWSQLGSYPAEPATGIPTNYEHTNPAGVTSLNATVGYTTQEEGNRIGYADLTFTPPNDGNYLEAVGSVKVNGQPSSSYVERGKGVSKIHIEPLQVGQAYDFMVESLNRYGLKGVRAEIFNRVIPGDNTIPKAPTSVVPKGKLNRVAWEWNAVTQNTDNSSITDLRGYQYRVWSALSGGVQRYPKDGGFGFTTDTRVEITDDDGDLATSKRTLYLEVRAIDRSGNVSSLTSRVSASTTEVGRDDIADHTTQIIEAVEGASMKPDPYTLNTWMEVIAAPTITLDRTAIVKVRFSGEFADGFGGNKLRVTRNGSQRYIYDDIPADDEHPSITFSDTVSAGNYTYRIEYRNNTIGGTGQGLRNRALSVQADFK